MFISLPQARQPILVALTEESGALYQMAVYTWQSFV
jgi:hypothetical protein